MYPDDATAEQWFIRQRWPNGIACPRCGSDNVNPKGKHPTMPHRCRCIKAVAITPPCTFATDGAHSPLLRTAGYQGPQGRIP